ISPSSPGVKLRNGAGGCGRGGTGSATILGGGGAPVAAAAGALSSRARRGTPPAARMASPRRQAAASLPRRRPAGMRRSGGFSRSVGPAAVERDAADQVGRTQQLIVGHGVLGRLIRIARRRGRRGGLVVLLVVFLVGRLGGFRLGVGRLVVLLVGRGRAV